MLVHCVAGKDRTGLVVALIQAAIGVTLESIVEEMRALGRADAAAPDGDDLGAAVG